MQRAADIPHFCPCPSGSSKSVSESFSPIRSSIFLRSHLTRGLSAGIRRRKAIWISIQDVPSLGAQLAEIFTAYNGIKMLEYQLPEPLYVHLLQRPDCQVILLRRKNLLQAVVSGLIAEQTIFGRDGI